MCPFGVKLQLHYFLIALDMKIRDNKCENNIHELDTL